MARFSLGTAPMRWSPQTLGVFALIGALACAGGNIADTEGAGTIPGGGGDDGDADEDDNAPDDDEDDEPTDDDEDPPPSDDDDGNGTTGGPDSGPDSGPVDPSDPPMTSGPPDPMTSGPPVPPPTTGDPPDVTDTTPQQTTGTPMTSEGGDGTGQIGEPCVENSDCESNVCVDDTFEVYCSDFCDFAEDCPTDWICVVTTTEGVNVCIP